MIKPHHILKLNKMLKMNNFVCRIGGQWFCFQDEKGSNTPAIVYEEISRGYYTPQQKLCPGDNVVDLGANTGMFTIPLAKRYPETNFICVEPDTKNFRNLVYNIQRAGVKNVLPLHLGLWSVDCEMKSIHQPGNSGGSHSTPAEHGECPGMTWETFRKTFNLETVKLLKMDVEGAEFHIIQRAEDLEGIGEIMAEIHGWCGNEYEMLDKLETVPLSRLQVLHANGKSVSYENRTPFQPRDLENYCKSCNRLLDTWDVDLCRETNATCLPY